MSGGSIKYGIWEQPRIVNPVLAQNNDSDNDLIQLIYDGLLAIGPGGEIINSLGSNLTISKDGKIYEVKLNEDVLWHDGTTFTSEDVLFTIDMIQDYRNESPFYNI
jgi:peptide/nickel transport system substrate-binding protein